MLPLKQGYKRYALACARRMCSNIGKHREVTNIGRLGSARSPFLLPSLSVHKAHKVLTREVPKHKKVACVLIVNITKEVG